MKRACAWCGERLDGGPGPPERISHGICQTCSDQLLAADGTPILDFLRSLDAPAVLVDSRRTVGAANAGIDSLISRRAQEAIGQRIGTVFECVYADAENGCGLSVHCSGCTIRRTVSHTWHTGEARSRVPATLKQIDSPAPRDIVFWISTRRVGNRVLVEIDHAPAIA